MSRVGICAPTYGGVASKAAAQEGVLCLAVCPAGWKPGSDTVSIIQPRLGGGLYFISCRNVSERSCFNPTDYSGSLGKAEVF